ncbi:MAG: hypothetical protein C4289_04960 [Chloroflexota bacterium]
MVHLADRAADTDIPGRTSRRALVAGALSALACYTFWPLVEPPLSVESSISVTSPPSVRVGATFSPVEPMYIGADWRQLYEDVLRLDLDYLRLAVYWNDIERRPGELTFTTLDVLLEGATRRRLPVTLTVGLKGPVYPEFHIPAWVLEEVRLPPFGLITRDRRLCELAHRFTQRAVEALVDADVIERWQVENEPFEPILYKNWWSLDRAFVERQVDIVRQADRRGRKIVLTAYVSTHGLLNVGVRLMDHPGIRHVLQALIGRRKDPALISLADVVGFDLYPGVGWQMLGVPLYFRAARAADYNPLLRWKAAAESAGRETAIMEAQAKPYEPGGAYYLGTGPYRSFAPHELLPFLHQLVTLGFRDICLWGVEHWAWHRRYGDPSWWQAGVAALAALRTA